MPTVLPPTNCYYEIYPEATGDRFSPDIDWQEYADGTSQGDSHFSIDGAAGGSIQGWIPYNTLRSFLLYSLGYAAAENQSPWRLKRINPPTHPIYPFLRVRSVTIRGFEPRRDHAVTTTEEPPAPPSPANAYPWFPYATGTRIPGAQDRTPVSEFEEWDGTKDHPATTMAARMWSMRPRMNGENFGYGSASGDDRGFFPFSYNTTRYEKAKVQVEFWQPPWPIIEDTDPTFATVDSGGGVMVPLSEAYRNVFWTTEPTLDVLALEGGQGNSLFWREGKTQTILMGGGTVPEVATNIPARTSSAVQPPLSGFKSPTGFLEPKLMDVANWMHVPERFIFDANLIPTKILTCLGKINSTDWFGYEAGTVLFMGASFQPVVWPIYSIDQPTVHLWNVKYHFKYHNPTRRPDGELTPNPAGAGKKGWRLFKYQDGFAYWATRFNGDDLYYSVDFRDLFKHREA